MRIETSGVDCSRQLQRLSLSTGISEGHHALPISRSAQQNLGPYFDSDGGGFMDKL